MGQDRQPGTGATAVFIIRIWREWSLTEPRWYGRVEWLNTDQTLAFRELSQLLAFLYASGLVDDAEQHSTDTQRSEK